MTTRTHPGARPPRLSEPWFAAEKARIWSKCSQDGRKPPYDIDLVNAAHGAAILLKILQEEYRARARS